MGSGLDAGGGCDMKISIIVCTRNRAPAILECLTSIAVAVSASSADHVELVVVDNGSEDDTGKVIKMWAASTATRCALFSRQEKVFQ
jgi:glycosyltransferase involved in cell wall biosynthesis